MKKNAIQLSIFKRAFQKDLNIIKISYVILLLAIVALAFILVTRGFKTVSERYKYNMDLRDSIMKKIVMSNKSTLIEIKKLKQLYVIIDQTKPQYYYLAESFNAFSYTFTIFLVIFSISTSILGFLIVKKGWDNISDYYLKTSFLMSLLLSSLFGILPNVFNNKENIKNNLTKYCLFTGLQMDILDLISDNKGIIKKGKSDSLNIIINKINLELKANQDLYFDIQIDRVSNKYTSDVLKEMK